MNFLFINIWFPCIKLNVIWSIIFFLLLSSRFILLLSSRWWTLFFHIYLSNCSQFSFSSQLSTLTAFFHSAFCFHFFSVPFLFHGPVAADNSPIVVRSLPSFLLFIPTLSLHLFIFTSSAEGVVTTAGYRQFELIWKRGRHRDMLSERTRGRGRRRRQKQKETGGGRVRRRGGRTLLITHFYVKRLGSWLNVCALSPTT